MIVSERGAVRRIPERASREWDDIRAILDAGSIAGVGFSLDGQPFVIPMFYGRRDETLFLHGSAASRLMAVLAAGAPACVTVTHVDGLVLARSAFHHSMNYRSVVAFGTARLIQEPRRKIEALRVMSEHLLPGRWAEVRGPNKRELTETTVLEMPIDEASAKSRSGPPKDDEADYRLGVWAGELPLATIARPPVPDDRMARETAPPEYVLRYAPAAD